MDDTLEKRVRTLERAVTDGDHDLTALAEEANALEKLDEIDGELVELADRVAELEAATQAIRGYVGNVRAVNEDVERRAETALAKAQSLEATLDEPPADRGRTETDHATATADGGVTRDRTAKANRCEACGRRYRGTEPASAATTGTPAESKTDPPSGESDRPPGEIETESNDETPGDTEETLVPETSETGTLRRIRKLL